ncbi:hypothetical protein TNCT_506241 [Trichonephila clavata]|uniref:Uncharacterized protein n=1 Tax=Trichonephila clavata TaxID=2740835 RepID=A0A8X6I6F6_TRICU|nr:hypothetical protein TNCT_506241 [Trichonephila clavata]
MALLIHLLCLSFLFLEQKFKSEQKVNNVISLDAENSFEHAVENFKTPKQHSPFKISTFALSEGKTYNLLDIAKESLVDISEKSWSNDKGDAFNFTNVDLENEEPELIETFKNLTAMNDWFPDLFNKKYIFFPISIDDTQEVVIPVSEIVETSKASTPNKHLENAPEKNSFNRT